MSNSEGNNKVNNDILSNSNSTDNIEPNDNEEDEFLADLPEPLPFRLHYNPTKINPVNKELAQLDQDFRESFEERMSARNIRLPQMEIVQDGEDLYRIIKIFRRVAQQMGAEWQPVFRDLVRKAPSEIFEEELKYIETHRPLIRGYKALMTWKAMSGAYFHIGHLYEALKKNNMEDIADEVAVMLKDNDPKNDNKSEKKVSSKSSIRRKKPENLPTRTEIFDNHQLLTLSKKTHKDWKILGNKLKIPGDDLIEIESYNGTDQEKAFKVLWSWKENTNQNELTKENVTSILKELGYSSVLEELFSKNC